MPSGETGFIDYFVIPHENVTDEYISSEAKKIPARLDEIYRRLSVDQEPENLGGKTVLVIDDGIATGNTLLGTISMLRKSKPRKIIIAVPVASAVMVEKLSPDVPAEFLVWADFTQILSR